jgi:hypothetical protein
MSKTDRAPSEQVPRRVASDSHSSGAEGVTRDLRGQDQPKDKATAQRASSTKPGETGGGKDR